MERVVGCHNQSPCWKDRFGECGTQRKKPRLQGAGKLCLMVLSPPALARAGAGVRGEAANAAWKHLNLPLGSNSPAAAEDRTSSAAWKQLVCSKKRALDANLRCLTWRQGRAWALSVIAVSVWTERW